MKFNWSTYSIKSSTQKKNNNNNNHDKNKNKIKYINTYVHKYYFQ